MIQMFPCTLRIAVKVTAGCSLISLNMFWGNCTVSRVSPCLHIGYLDDGEAEVLNAHPTLHEVQEHLEGRCESGRGVLGAGALVMPQSFTDSGEWEGRCPRSQISNYIGSVFWQLSTNQRFYWWGGKGEGWVNWEGA